MPKVYTMGYAQLGAAQRLDELMSEQSMLLIDTRMSPRTSYKPWDGNMLRNVWGKRYRQAGQFLGNVNYQGGPIQIANPSIGVDGLIRYLLEGHDLVLLCGCKNYSECHRHVIVDMLRQKRPDIEIVPEPELVTSSKCGDVVVTVPQSFGLDTWINEGDPAGAASWSGDEWHFYLGGYPPKMNTGDRVYVVYNGVLRGYAPLVRIDESENGGYGLVRHGGAIAVTIPEYVQGFRGFRYRWWDRSIEVPFPEWSDSNALPDGVVRPPRSISTAKKKPVSRKSKDECEIEQGVRNIARMFGVPHESLMRNIEDIG